MKGPSKLKDGQTNRSYRFDLPLEVADLISIKAILEHKNVTQTIVDILSEYVYKPGFITLPGDDAVNSGVGDSHAGSVHATRRTGKRR